MTPERWAKIEELFFAAAELRDGAREDYLREVCAGDAELRKQVEDMLAADDGSGTEFHDAVHGEAVALNESAAAGKRFGNWLVTGIIGKGGMGAVYRAVRNDEQFKQEAAVKVLRCGLDSEFALARFRHERQILATLEHPNIARLIDGGQDGEPYIVLELIAGVPITDFCRERKLSIADTLRLFRTAMGAVQYAHQRFIIHRDLKPANILVTADGTPKLLDFGIAKLNDPDYHTETLAQTSTGMQMMTPDYASPEQVLGQPVSAASDVYSLGAVLYELLTNTKPHRIERYDALEIARAVCETAIVDPASVRQELAGDLDVILMKALSKEPERRYASVQEFADDIQRFLDFEPVRARPDTTWYRTRKYARRHWVGLVAAAFSVTALCVGTGVALYQARQARAQFNDVRQLANKFLFEFHDAIANTPGTLKARELVVSTALEYLNKLSARAADDPGLQWERATAYGKVAEAQGAAGAPSLSRPADGVASYEKAFVLARALADKRLLSVSQQEAFVKMLSLAGQMHRGLHQYDAAKKLGQEAVERSSQLSAATKWLALFHLSATLGRAGELLESVEIQSKLLPISREIVKSEPTIQNRNRLAHVLVYLGYALSSLTRFDEARALEMESMEIYRAVLKELPGNSLSQGHVSTNLTFLGVLEGSGEGPSAGNWKEAARYFSEGLEITNRAIAADPNDKESHLNAVRFHIQIASTLAEYSPADALRHAQAAIAILDETKVGVGWDWVSSRLLSGNALRKLRQFAAAERMLKATESRIKEPGVDREGDLELAWAQFEFAIGKAQSGHLEKAIAIRESALAKEPVPNVAWTLVQALEFAAEVEPASSALRRKRIQAVWSDQNRRYPGSPYLEARASKK